MNRGAIAWFIHNPVASNVLMIVVLVVGFFTMGSLRQEIVPSTQVDAVLVSVAYPGASPQEVEEAICMRIEESVQGLSGVDRVQSQANENFGTVTVEYLDSVDRNVFLDDVKAEIDRIDTFPEETEEPMVTLIDVNNQVIEIAIWGEADAWTLRRVAEDVRSGLQQQKSITQVRLANVADFEIALEVSEEQMQRYGLSFDEVSAAVRRSSLDLPGGALKTRGGEILVRSKGQAYSAQEFRQLPLRSLPDGTQLRVGDVATVVDGFADTDQLTRFNDHPAITLSVFRVGEQSAIAVAEEAKAYLDQVSTELPEGISLTIYGDDSRLLGERMDLMLNNGAQGLLLVLIALSLFLRLRLALWVTLGIPIALLGSAALMPMMDVSINMISLMAFITVLGIVVDDAIVVAENIHNHRQRGKDGLSAAIDGTREMTVPVIFAVLTTIVAFMPMLFMPGSMGQFSRNIPLIVVACLAFSLIESLWILPSHLRHLPKEGKDQKRGIWGRLQDKVNRGLERFIQRFYEPSLAIATRWRYATLGLGVATLLFTAAYAGSGRVKFNFFPVIEADNIVAELTMPLGTPLYVTEAALAKLEQTALELQEELRNEDGEPLIKSIATAVGGQPYREKQSKSTGGQGANFSGGHLAEVNLELLSSELRTLSASDLGRMWQQRAGGIAGAEELVFNSDLMGGDGDIDIRLSGPDLDGLKEAAAELSTELSAVGGVIQAQDSYREGKREWQLSLTPLGSSLGLTLGDLARQVRQGMYGEELQSIQRGRDEVDVMLRYPIEDRRSPAALDKMRVRTADGREIPFHMVAKTTVQRGYSTIDRSDRQRSLRVTATIDPGLTTPDQVFAQLQAGPLPSILAAYPGLSYGLEGRQKEQGDFMKRMMELSLLAMLVIFALLAIPLKSYMQPLIIMSAIPFGLVGAVWGHAIMGTDMAIMSVIGIAALGGVVINDSLVMIDYINRLRADGTPLRQAVLQAGSRRFRPILLTTVTTFLGLSPLLLERSLQAQFLIPMAISLAFGVVFATAITLVLVPSLYLAIEDLGDLGRALVKRLPGAQKRRIQA
jgi:multidrug efflux pump subunit AcrB